jgi:hypothetical protein
MRNDITKVVAPESSDWVFFGTMFKFKNGGKAVFMLAHIDLKSFNVINLLDGNRWKNEHATFAGDYVTRDELREFLGRTGEIVFVDSCTLTANKGAW